MNKFKFYIDFDIDGFDAYPVDKDRVTEAVYTALESAEFEENSYLSYSFVSKEDMQELNREHKGKDSVTDVLSFPQYDEEGFVAVDEEDVFLGDIVICPERIAEQAEEYGHSFLRELTYISVHSALHLLGYDHIDPEDKLEMRAMEKKVMGRLSEVHDDL